MVLNPLSQKIALCLSGGGFRATLFHLGVVRALHDAGWLSRIRYISSVSGGSILAAHLVLNWNRYSGTAEEFDDAAAEVLRFAQKDIRGRIARRYIGVAVARGAVTAVEALLGPLLPTSVIGWFEKMKDRLTPTGLLEHYYSGLYRGARLFGLPVHDGPAPERDETPPPELHILGTNITKATVASFSGYGFLSSQDSAHAHGREIIKVSEAVAASSAFPGFFPPLHLSRRSIEWDLSELATEDQYVADAGIVDNLGLSILLQIEEAADLDFVVVSDATGSVDWAVAKRMRHVIGSTLRTLEILTGQSTKLTKDRVYQDFVAMKKDWTPVYLFIEISSLLDKSRVSNQASLKSIRTDLDHFSGTEIFSLAQHGYALARDALKKLGSQEAGAADVSEEWPLRILGRRRRAPEREHGELMRSGDVRLGLKGFVRDWLGWAYLLLLFGGPVVGYLLLQGYLERSVAAGTRIERNHKVAWFKAQPPRLVEPFEYGEPDNGQRQRPENPAFEFLEDTRYFDLRRWKPSPEGAGKAQSTITMVRETRVRKLKSEKYLRIQLKTSGTDVYMRSPREVKKYKVKEEETTGAQMKVREIVLDLHDVEVGGEETLVLEATFHDAFQTPEQWWAGALVQQPTPRVGLVVIFPKDRPYTSLECQRKANAGPRAAEGWKTIACTQLLEGNDRTYVYWEIDEPEIDTIYGLRWGWPGTPAP